MPKGIALGELTGGHAIQFVKNIKDRGLAISPVHKRVKFSRQFFQDAIDWELITANRFGRVKTRDSSTMSNVVSRFGGLCCPSEVLSLKWEIINWAHERISVPEPKVEHHEGRGFRVVRYSQNLNIVLKDLREITPKDAEYVIDKPEYRAAAMRPGGWANANLRTQLLKKAGLTPWERLFHSMRASRQTELESLHPTHVVFA